MWWKNVIHQESSCSPGITSRYCQINEDLRLGAYSSKTFIIYRRSDHCSRFERGMKKKESLLLRIFFNNFYTVSFKKKERATKAWKNQYSQSRDSTVKKKKMYFSSNKRFAEEERRRQKIDDFRKIDQAWKKKVAGSRTVRSLSNSLREIEEGLKVFSTRGAIIDHRSQGRFEKFSVTTCWFTEEGSRIVSRWCRFHWNASDVGYRLVRRWVSFPRGRVRVHTSV